MLIKDKLFGKLLFWFSIGSLMLPLFFISRIDEVNYLGLGAAIKYMWIYYLFAILPIISIIYSYKLKKLGLKYKKNKFIGFIILPLILIYGSFTFIFSPMYSYDYNKVQEFSKTIKLDLPVEGKISTELRENGSFSHVKFTNKKEVESFNKEIQDNPKWINSLPTNLSSMLPSVEQIQVANFDYFVVYNVTLNEYNTYPSSNGDYDFIYLCYYEETSKMIIIEFPYKINN